MSYTRGIDKNQPAIVKALRDAGCSVLDLSQVGGGCPDILIGFARPNGKRVNILAEIKDPECKRWKGNLKPNQQEFFDKWLGRVEKITTVEEALEIIRNK